MYSGEENGGNTKEKISVQIIHPTMDVEDEACENKLDNCNGMVLENSEVLKCIDFKIKHLDPKKSGNGGCDKHVYTNHCSLMLLEQLG